MPPDTSRRGTTSAAMPAVRRAAGSAVAGLALATVVGCGAGGTTPAATTATVSVCVEDDPSRTGAAEVEVRQDGEVVGSVFLDPSGTGTVEIPPGPVEAYVDDTLVGSGDISAGGGIAFSCATASPSGGATTGRPTTDGPVPDGSSPDGPAPTGR